MRRRHGAAVRDERRARGRAGSAGRAGRDDTADDRVFALQRAAGNAAVAALVLQRMMTTRKRAPVGGTGGGGGSGDERKDKKHEAGHGEQAPQVRAEQGRVGNLRFLPATAMLAEGQLAGDVYYDAQTIGRDRTVLTVGEAEWAFNVTMTGANSSITYKPKVGGRYKEPKGREGRLLVEAFLAHIGALVRAAGGATCVVGAERSAFAVFAALYTDDTSPYKGNAAELRQAIIAASPQPLTTAAVFDELRPWLNVLLENG